jgi:Na+-transporting NADH:ubiquinone oxidoreductase subunit NqrD
MNIMIDEIHDTKKQNTSELIARFERYGEIIHTIKRGRELAKVGKIKGEQVFVVFYPGGEYEPAGLVQHTRLRARRLPLRSSMNLRRS